MMFRRLMMAQGSAGGSGGAGGNTPWGGWPPSNEIWYTTTDGTILDRDWSQGVKSISDATLAVESHTYENGIGKVRFSADVGIIGRMGLDEVASSLTKVCFPSSVLVVEAYAFRWAWLKEYWFNGYDGIYCPNIQYPAFNYINNFSANIYINAITPPSEAMEIADDKSSISAVYVPSSAVDGYKAVLTGFEDKIKPYNF